MIQKDTGCLMALYKADNWLESYWQEMEKQIKTRSCNLSNSFSQANTNLPTEPILKIGL